MSLDLDNQLRIRRAILRLGQKADGGTVSLMLNEGDPDPLAEYAVAFGRSRKVGVRIEKTTLSLQLIRDDRVLASKYAVIDTLEIGQVHTFALHQRDHDRVRMAVSKRGQDGSKRFTCNVVEGGLQVTRIELDAPLTRGRPRGSGKQWNLAPLAHLFWVDLEATPLQLSAARQAVSTFQRSMGWMLHARIVGGKLRVWRLDHQAEGPAPFELEQQPSA